MSTCRSSDTLQTQYHRHRVRWNRGVAAVVRRPHTGPSLFCQQLSGGGQVYSSVHHRHHTYIHTHNIIWLWKKNHRQTGNIMITRCVNKVPRRRHRTYIGVVVVLVVSSGYARGLRWGVVRDGRWDGFLKQVAAVKDKKKISSAAAVRPRYSYSL